MAGSFEDHIFEKYGIQRSGAGSAIGGMAGRLEAEAEKNEAWVKSMLSFGGGAKSVNIGKIEVVGQSARQSPTFQAALQQGASHARAVLGYDPTVPSGHLSALDVEFEKTDVTPDLVASRIADAARIAASRGQIQRSPLDERALRNEMPAVRPRSTVALQPVGPLMKRKRGRKSRRLSAEQRKLLHRRLVVLQALIRLKERTEKRKKKLGDSIEGINVSPVAAIEELEDANTEGGTLLTLVMRDRQLLDKVIKLARTGGKTKNEQAEALKKFIEESKPSTLEQIVKLGLFVLDLTKTIKFTVGLVGRLRRSPVLGKVSKLMESKELSSPKLDLKAVDQWLTTLENEGKKFDEAIQSKALDVLATTEEIFKGLQTVGIDASGQIDSILGKAVDEIPSSVSGEATSIVKLTRKIVQAQGKFNEAVTKMQLAQLQAMHVGTVMAIKKTHTHLNNAMGKIVQWLQAGLTLNYAQLNSIHQHLSALAKVWASIRQPLYRYGQLIRAFKTSRLSGKLAEGSPQRLLFDLVAQDRKLRKSLVLTGYRELSGVLGIDTTVSRGFVFRTFEEKTQYVVTLNKSLLKRLAGRRYGQIEKLAGGGWWEPAGMRERYGHSAIRLSPEIAAAVKSLGVRFRKEVGLALRFPHKTSSPTYVYLKGSNANGNAWSGAKGFKDWCRKMFDRTPWNRPLSNQIPLRIEIGKSTERTTLRL